MLKITSWHGKKPKTTDTKVTLRQFPLSLNHATTGHKLQGKTIEQLIVSEWPANIRNWVYVVLSRVKQLDQIFLKDPIPDDITDEPDEMMLWMMEKLRYKTADEDTDAIQFLRLIARQKLDNTA